jgi:hypothetical protein
MEEQVTAQPLMLPREPAATSTQARFSLGLSIQLVFIGRVVEESVADEIIQIDVILSDEHHRQGPTRLWGIPCFRISRLVDEVACCVIPSPEMLVEPLFRFS